MPKFKAGDIVKSKTDGEHKIVILYPKRKIFNQKYIVRWFDDEYHRGLAFEAEIELLTQT